MPVTYPGHYDVRRVSRNGGIRWGHHWVNVSHLLAELDVGFEGIDDGLWEVSFGPIWLGRLHEATYRIVDHLGRAARRTGGNHKGTCYPSPELFTACGSRPLGGQTGNALTPQAIQLRRRDVEKAGRRAEYRAWFMPGTC